MASMPSRSTTAHLAIPSSASILSAQAAGSSFPVGPPISLPALQPTDANGQPVPSPAVYCVRLPNEVAKALISDANASIRFDDINNGVISIPSLREVPFTSNPVKDGANDRAHAACFSRRGDKLRNVGPIIADLHMGEGPNAPAKRRISNLSSAPLTAHQRNQAKLSVDNPNGTNPTTAKRPRKSVKPQTTEKRPRPTPLSSRPSPQPPHLANPPLLTQPRSLPNPPSTKHPTSKPTPSLTPPNSLPVPPSSSNTSPPLPAPPGRPHPNGYKPSHRLYQQSGQSRQNSTMRSPTSPNISPSGRLPQPKHVLTSMPSNGHGPGNGYSNGRNNVNNNYVTTNGGSNNSNGSGSASGSGTPSGLHAGISKQKWPSFSGLKPAKVSPLNSAGLLPHPNNRRPSHISPNRSRGPSPTEPYLGLNSHTNRKSPTSPRVQRGGHHSYSHNNRLQPHSHSLNSEQRKTLRLRAIHILAAGERSVDALRSRLGIEEGSEMAHVLSSSVVREVGQHRGANVFELRRDLWSEVNDDFEELNEVERAKIKMTRATHSSDMSSSFQKKNDEDSDGDVMMKLTKIEEQLSSFDKEEGSSYQLSKVGQLSESHLRKKFSKWHPTYRLMIAQMDDMRSGFKKLEKLFTDSRSTSDRSRIVKKIENKNEKFGPSKQRLEKYLPVMHKLLRDIKQALNDHAAKDNS